MLPIVGGYAFCSIWIVSLFHSARESGHRLYFRAVFYAVVMCIMAGLIHVWIFLNPAYQAWLSIIVEFFGSAKATASLFGNESQIAICFSAFVLGPFLAHALNIWKWPWVLPYRVPWFGWRPFRAFQMMILRHSIKNNDFEKLITHSYLTYIPILFTLISGKCYIGWPVKLPNPSVDRKFVRLLPALSGYRNENTHKLEITTDYLSVLLPVVNNSECIARLEVSDFEIIFKLDQLSSAHLFDLEAYKLFLSQGSGIIDL